MAKKQTPKRLAVKDVKNKIDSFSNKASMHYASAVKTAGNYKPEVIRNIVSDAKRYDDSTKKYQGVLDRGLKLKKASGTAAKSRATATAKSLMKAPKPAKPTVLKAKKK